MTSSDNIQSLRVGFADLNGQVRGKRLPAEDAIKVEEGSTRAPLSAANLDIWGADIDASPMVFATGDADGTLHPTGRGPVLLPWLSTPTALHPTMMHTEEGHPFAGDPRQALVSCLKRYQDKGLTVQAATELEFYLLDPDTLSPAKGAQVPQTEHAEHILSMQTLDAFEGFFDALYAGAEVMGIPAQAAISESGPGQFEINLTHQDALRAADDCWLFKQLIKGTAQAHGLLATFAAKPFADQAGNGLHVHFSVLDAAGQNIFDDGADEGSTALTQAIAGCLAAMPESTLIFAPHSLSYDRLVPHAHAPTGVAWAYENRTVAIRVPGGLPKARRIEHRVAGGDANPYLLLTAILGAAFEGMEQHLTPPAPLTGNAYDQDLPQIPITWSEAMDHFAKGQMITRIFTQLLIENLLLTKRQEQAKSENTPTDALRALHLSLL